MTDQANYCAECPRKVQPPFDLCVPCARKSEREQLQREERDAPHREPDGADYL